MKGNRTNHPIGEASSKWKGGEHKNSDGYVIIYHPNHPRAHSDGYVKRSILVWEEANQKPFPVGKEPHHDNEIRDDDRPENIIPLTHSEHTRHHHPQLKRR